MIVLNTLVILAISGLFFKQAAGVYPRLFCFALLVKMAMAVSLGLVYLYYYTANDTWLFFTDATTLADYARHDFGSYLKFLWNNDPSSVIEISNMQERSLFLVKIVSFFSFISNNNYWITAIYFSLISFIASWNLFRVIARNFDNSQSAAALAFLFFPSVIFWSSGLVKETLALAGIYFVALVFIKTIKSEKIFWWEWITTFLAFYAVWNLKYYWAALFLAVVITSILVFFLQKKIKLLSQYRLFGWSVIFILLSGIVSLLHPNFYLNRFLDVLITNHNDFLRISRPDGIIHYYNLSSSWWSVFINSPWALLSGLFRPVLGEASGATSIVASIENLFLFVLVIACLFRKWTMKDNLLLLSSGVYIVLLCIFLALSTPNLGTLSRYRVGFLPFFIFIIAYRNPLLDYLLDRFK
ncbi:MAG: hypothetical protein JNM78_01650 [Cyclobacteriaceae bacterium]|nr:hypothetical protein [Cyclobacteriaceae bacterium]